MTTKRSSLSEYRLRGGLSALLVGLFCLLAAFGVAWIYARVLAPERGAGTSAARTGGGPARALREAVAPAPIAEIQQRLLAHGSRYLGQKGRDASESEVRAAFSAAGLAVVEQHIRTVVPVTSRREIAFELEGGSGTFGPALPGVEVYPFMPNHLQPVVTPPTGLVGRLLVLDPATLAAAKDLSDVIGILDAGAGGVDPAYGFHWARYASLGVKALVIAHRAGFSAIDWNLVAQKKSGLVSSVPVNFVRLAANERIFEHAGRRVRLDVRVDFREVPSRTLVGVLHAPEPSEEALVISAPHDTAAVLPDLAPGALPAIQTAYLLSLLRGLAAERSSLRRDVVFLSAGSSVMGEDGLNQLLRVLRFNTFGVRENRLFAAFGADGNAASVGTPNPALAERLAPITRREHENREALARVEAIRLHFREPAFLETKVATERALAGLDAQARTLFEDQLGYVLENAVLEEQERVLAAKLAFERTGRALGSPALSSYHAARRRLDTHNALAGASALALLTRSPGSARAVELRARAEQRFRELSDWHRERLRELASDRRVAEVFSRYRGFDVVKTSFAPATSPGQNEVLSLHAHPSQGTQSLELLLEAGARERGYSAPGFRIERMAANQPTLVENNCQPWPLADYAMLYATGYQGAGLVNFERQDAYQQWASPVVKPFMLELESLRGSFAATAELVLSVARGEGTLSAPPGYSWQRRSYGGRVLVANVGKSLVPKHPLARALVGARSVDGEEQYSELGYWRQPFAMTDPYGRYDLPEQAADFPGWWRVYGRGYAYTPVAAGYGSDGLIAYLKNEGAQAQDLFKSVDVPMGNEAAVANTTIVTFRAAPFSLLDLTNPRDFKDYAEVRPVTRDGLLPFGAACQFSGLGFVTTYLPPDQYTKVLLLAGTADNARARETGAFLLGPIRGGREGTPERAGAGYLVADHPFLLRVPFEVARSMTHVNGVRLALQNRYQMADARTNAYQKNAVTLLEQAGSAELPVRQAEQRARDAVSFAALNHPVLQRSLFEAVVGILFYLGLLVPCVFFAEKLLFCCSDPRRQLAAQALLFLAAFGALRVLHPAFQMVRSSLMILLGFVIVLCTVAITLLFSSKAQDSLSALERGKGRVAGAEVDKLGVLLSAFLVGLNNMHRRRLRTGLTAATLTLLTFVMICFTSLESDVVSETDALGGAEYQGLLVKHDDFLPLSKSEVFALQSRFGARFPVVERRFLAGMQDWNERKRQNPSLNAAFESGTGRREATFGSILKLAPEEPLKERLAILTRRGWFLPEHARDDGKPCPVLLPDRLAERLGLTREHVDQGEALVSINGKQFLVWGLFSASSLDRLRDLDGRDLLPFDLERASTASESSVGATTVTTAGADEPRIPAERIVISPVRELGFFAANARELVASVAVNLGGHGYAEARAEVEAHLEKTARPAYFGLDGVAYRGRRARELGFSGLLELLVPLLLAGLTVLGTMKGSVHERRSEIYVYNAVGIAPRYVLAMFLAEAMVYAVIGAVLGYLASQAVGRVLTALDLTAGLRMTFTSLHSIYVSVAVGALVLLSTWFPARDAVRIAAPAEESGWRLPEPNGDELAFELPFTFDARARLAVLAFFERWFSTHGEGSAGPFFANTPVLSAKAATLDDSAPLVPKLSVSVWLKPFDLAVSQRVSIVVPFDAEGQEFRARLRLTRLSGTREAWLRLNATFVSVLRRHFLHWRAVGADEQAELFDAARTTFESQQPEFANEPGEARA